MRKPNRKTLILNADWVPIHLRSWQKAITMICKGKAIQVDFYKDDEIKGAHGKKYEVPAVIALRDYVHRDYKKAPLTRSNVFARDSYTCQYCLRTFRSGELTLDHVIPRSRWTGEGSPTCWTNLVTACIKCNSDKADKICSEAAMWPIKSPVQPGYDEIFFGISIHNRLEPEWLPWLRVFKLFKDIEDKQEKYIVGGN